MRNAIILVAMAAVGIGGYILTRSPEKAERREAAHPTDVSATDEKPASHVADQTTPRQRSESTDTRRVRPNLPSPPLGMNGDGNADDERLRRREERRASALERFDTNGNGIIDDDERAALREARGGEGRRKRMLENFDSDGDGELNDDERAMRDQARKNMAAERAARVMTAGDKNADGKISRAEAESGDGRWRRILDQFEELDTDGDNALSAEELAQSLTRRRERRDRAAERPE